MTAKADGHYRTQSIRDILFNGLYKFPYLLTYLLTHSVNISLNSLKN